MIPAECLWPRDQLARAWESLVRFADVHPVEAATPAAPRWAPADGAAEERRRVDEWITSVADTRGLEAQVVTIDALTETRFFARAAPALVVTSRESEAPEILLVTRAKKDRLELLTRDLQRVWIKATDAKLGELGSRTAPSWERRVLAAAGVTTKSEAPAILALRGGVELKGLGIGYTLRAAASRTIGLQTRQRKIEPRVMLLALVTLLTVAANMGGLYLIGVAALNGQAHPRGLVGWALLVLLNIPLRLLARRIQAGLVLDTSVLMRRRLFEGVLRLPLDWVREKGVGSFVALVTEAEAVESFALRVGAGSLASAANVIGGLTFIAFGPSALPVLALAVSIIGVTIFLSVRWFRALRLFTQRRMTTANDLVAKMVGHRTRLAQSRPDEWHAGEDEMMGAKLAANRTLDRYTIMLGAIPRVWSIAALLVLAPVFLGARTSTSSLMVGAAGTLVFAGALQSLVDLISDWGRLVVGWETVGDLIKSGEASPAPVLSVEVEPRARQKGDVVLDAVGLNYRYRAGGRAALSNASIQVKVGDRLLIEGPSGGGKSTLATVLAGLRRPESGLLLVGGLDQHTQSAAGWRRVVAVAPQFHENYVFLNTLRFNLLLGRPWPPSEEDMKRAAELCVELGLGPLLEKMPSGLYQMVGDSGWQLSHGERSRVYVARALLQDSDVVVFDESFGALDPETLMQCIDCVFRHGRSLMVIAHP
jgi:ATP-binding cassette subfamily B protein